LVYAATQNSEKSLPMIPIGIARALTSLTALERKAIEQNKNEIVKPQELAVTL
jgi:hypothetical protein